MLQERQQQNTNMGSNSSLFGWVSASAKQILKYFEPRESSPDLIYRCSPEDLQELERRLQTRKLSPNHRGEARVTILHDTMLRRREAIEKAVPILLRYGADPNLLWGREKEDSGPLTFLFDEEKFTLALAKLFLTYGADYRVYEPIVLHEDYFEQFKKLSLIYYPLSQTLKRAHDYFKAGQYENARREYKTALKSLEQFAEEDEQKQGDLTYGYREQYVQDYRLRAEICRAEIQKCEQRLLQQNDDADHSDDEKTSFLSKKNA